MPTAAERSSSCPPDIQAPHKPLGIAPLRLALHDEVVGADRELIAGARIPDLARPQLEGRGLGVDAGVAAFEQKTGSA
jgi:hypothetical protein